MNEKKLDEVIGRLNELRFRLEPVEQHWGWTAEQLHRELRHVLHTLNGIVTDLRAASTTPLSGESGTPETAEGAADGADTKKDPHRLRR
jgi:hypothetical protein